MNSRKCARARAHTRRARDERRRMGFVGTDKRTATRFFVFVVFFFSPSSLNGSSVFGRLRVQSLPVERLDVVDNGPPETLGPGCSLRKPIKSHARQAGGQCNPENACGAVRFKNSIQKTAASVFPVFRGRFRSRIGRIFHQRTFAQPPSRGERGLGIGGAVI